MQYVTIPLGPTHVPANLDIDGRTCSPKGKSRVLQNPRC